jgi:hypothetical protein
MSAIPSEPRAMSFEAGAAKSASNRLDLAAFGLAFGSGVHELEHLGLASRLHQWAREHVAARGVS